MPRRSFDRTAAILGVLRDRELRSLFFSDWISDVGNFITAIALAVLYELATAIGSLAFARHERRRLAPHPVPG